MIIATAWEEGRRDVTINEQWNTMSKENTMRKSRNMEEVMHYKNCLTDAHINVNGGSAVIGWVMDSEDCHECPK